MRVIFMGSPDFAVPCLQKLISSTHEIVAVYTKPPQPAGRGHHLAKSKIHLLAEQNGLLVHCPASLKPAEEVQKILSFNADVAVVAAYGLILRTPVLQAPKFGCINIHPSALPRFRGAAPIQRTIMAGDRQTEVCIMRMDEGLDTGDVVIRQSVDIPEGTTAKELHDQTAAIGGDLVLQVLAELAAGTATFNKQSEQGVTYANKLQAEDEIINWNLPARLVACQIHALSPKPGAYFNFTGEKIKIITANYDEAIKHDQQPGTVLDDKLTIACAKGVLLPTLMQRQGRKMIYTDAFLRGFTIPVGALVSAIDRLSTPRTC
jgi:methionyl-tRNA formyltransferase